MARRNRLRSSEIEPQTVQPQGGDPRGNRFAVQNSDDDGFAEHARQNENTKIDRFRSSSHPETSSPAAPRRFGDVEVGHDLQARHRGVDAALHRQIH